MLVFQLKKQTTTQKSVSLKINLLITTMTNTFITPEFNTLPADVSNAGLAQANLIAKTAFDVKLLSLNRNIT